VACTSRVMTVIGHKKDSFDHHDRVVKILRIDRYVQPHRRKVK